MNKVQKKRLFGVVTVLLMVFILVGLVIYALRSNLNHFYTPTDIQAEKVSVGHRIRVGGLVLEGSVTRDSKSLRVSFGVTDTKEQVFIEYEGILPDLFREGQGVVVVGDYLGKPKGFHLIEADQVLAKHDENYMPPEAMEAIKRAGHIPNELHE